MSDVDELAVWLREKITGDHRAALAARPGPWAFDGDEEVYDEPTVGRWPTCAGAHRRAGTSSRTVTT